MNKCGFAALVHYATLTVGLFIILKMLGFSLGQITILGGALGVGIGFGLQAIVNNFVSGLILLFEQPLKVGDMIEVGVEVGEVKELGLRATTVQTNDNPMELIQPEPKALFLAFGASSLDFELWVWIHDFSDRVIVPSDLNQDLETKLQLAKIEIPFPQTDLHRRSIDQEAATVLHKTARNSEGLKNMVAVLP